VHFSRDCAPTVGAGAKTGHKKMTIFRGVLKKYLTFEVGYLVNVQQARRRVRIWALHLA
jgi:hypothetical protein